MNPRIVPFLAWLAFIVYGSLVPLDFTPMPLDAAWARFQQTPFLQLGVESRADWVANGVLYVPLGLLSARWLAAILARWPRLVTSALAIAGCWAVAFAVEFAQVFFPPRTVSQNDLLAECIGSVLGAMLLPFVGGWLDRLVRALPTGDGRLWRLLLQGYAVGYLLLCFFPFDLLLSRSELQDKIASDLWAWVLTSPERGLFFTLLQLGAELVLSVPVGLLAARASASSMQRVGKGLAVGFALGLFIEVGQFFVASGVSQGASVLSRMLGVAAGSLLAPHLATAGLDGARRLLARSAWPLLALYLPLLLFVNGWFRQPWQGLGAAARSWAELRLMPFYYHYWTTEALALFSLASVALMYLPAAAIGWARGAPVRRTMLAVGGLALGIEVSKLFLSGARPDPTNVLIAAASALGLFALLSLAGRRAVETTRQAAESAGASPTSAEGQRAPVEAAGPSAASRTTGRGGWPWLLMLPLVAVEALRFPAWSGLLVALLAAAALAVAWRPVLALALLPAALPVLDLAPWTGRVFVDEFDLLLATCLAVAGFRTAGSAARREPRLLTLAFVLLALSLAASTVRGLWPALVPPAVPEPDAWANYFSPWSALRIVKGAAEAALFVLLWRRLGAATDRRTERDVARRSDVFSAGMLAGLALTVLAILWERATFAGVFDFSADFRVTGLISAMHRGGAYIECYLAVASAFAAWWVLKARSLAGRAVAVSLLVLACYSMMVTYSRNGYAALLVALLGAAAIGLPWRRAGWRAWGPAIGLVLGLAAALVPLLGGSYARERLSQSGRDLAVRQAHWADALQMRDGELVTALVGMGIGRYPETHFWRSKEPVRAATWRLMKPEREDAAQGGAPWLRLGGGATVYLEQILPRPGEGELTLSLELRSERSPAALTLSLCEKWILTSVKCVPVTAQAAGGGGEWQRVQVGIDPTPALAGRWPLRAPLKLSIFTPADGSTVDVRRLRLVSSSGEELLANGDFSAGLDRWTFTTDVDPPWHVHNLPLAVLFDQGWLGVAAWALVVVGCLVSALRLHVQGVAALPISGVAVLAFGVSGLLNTLIDAPRFLWLLLVLLWLAAEPALVSGGTSHRSSRQRPRRRDMAPS